MVNIIFGLIRSIKKKSLIKKLNTVGENFVWKGKYIHNAEKVSIGNDVYIGPKARLHALGGIIIGNGVISGPRLTIYTYNHNYYNAKLLPYDEVYLLKKVKIEKNVWLGDSVFILPGVTIGEGSIVGMSSVVTKDIPPFSVVGGNPARVIKKRDDIKNYNNLSSRENNYLYNKYKYKLKPDLRQIL